MQNIKKQWFTLVELIVVITILAILWSIAFISLQGYSSDARNSKRTSDLNSIQSAMSTQLAQWQTILSFATRVTNNETTALSIAWTWVVAWTDYAAWTINYASLPVKSTDFQDPTWVPYVVGVTTKVNGRYELAAKVEQWAGSAVAKVVWNFSPRSSGTPVVWALISTWVVTTNVTLNNNSDINLFTPGDTVTSIGGTAFTTTITKISTDGKTLTLATWATTATWLRLTVAESVWLVNDVSATNTTATIVTEWGNILPY